MFRLYQGHIPGIFIPIFNRATSHGKGGELMAKVKVIKRYNDIVLKKTQEKGTVFEVSEARAKHLVEQKMVEIVEEKKPEKKG